MLHVILSIVLHVEFFDVNFIGRVERRELDFDLGLISLVPNPSTQ